MSDSQRVAYLAEALPYIQKYAGKIFVIKYGGSALKNDDIALSVIKDLVLLNTVGIKTILVHGGGPEINAMLDKIGKQVEFEDGLRKTDQETMEVVEMVLHGKVQRRLVTMINKAGAKAIGVSGRDGRIVLAQRHPAATEDNLVGEVQSTNLELIHQIMELGFIPVISSIAPDEDGVAFNINADSMTAAIGSEMQADKVLLMTDTPGVLMDKDKPETLLKELDVDKASGLIQDKIIQGGMIPKVECCINAVNQGVSEAIILDGFTEHCLLLETFTDQGCGTRIARGIA